MLVGGSITIAIHSILKGHVVSVYTLQYCMVITVHEYDILL